MIRLIAAIDRKRGLAKQGFQPWNIPQAERSELHEQNGFVFTYANIHIPNLDQGPGAILHKNIVVFWPDKAYAKGDLGVLTTKHAHY